MCARAYIDVCMHVELAHRIQAQRAHRAASRAEDRMCRNEVTQHEKNALCRNHPPCREWQALKGRRNPILRSAPTPQPYGVVASKSSPLPRILGLARQGRRPHPTPYRAHCKAMKRNCRGRQVECVHIWRGCHKIHTLDLPV